MPVMSRPSVSGPANKTSVLKAGRRVLILRPNRKGKMDNRIKPPTMGDRTT